MLPVEITWLHKTENLMIFPVEKLKTCDLIDQVSNHFHINSDNFYFVQNGRLLESDNIITNKRPVRAVLKVLGGKGGFGSMLRAIGAQIEKTTNREACRDLSGRRLRDINEEKRLKTWIGQQAERERQEAERKQRKLDKLRAEPKHEFSDKQYEEERSQLIDKVHDAVEHGFSSIVPSTEPSTSKTADSKKPMKRKPKKKGFMFEDEELSLSESDEGTLQESDEGTLQEPEVSSKRELESNEDSECSPFKKQKTILGNKNLTTIPNEEKAEIPFRETTTIQGKEVASTCDEEEAETCTSASNERAVSA